MCVTDTIILIIISLKKVNNCNNLDISVLSIKLVNYSIIHYFFPTLYILYPYYYMNIYYN